MAQRNEKVFDRVRQELANNPNLGSKELYDLAQGVEKSIGQDSLQQFHARYVLPVKRERGGKGKVKQGSRPTQRRGRSRTTSAVAAAAPSKPVAEKPAEVSRPAAAAGTASAATRSRRPRQSAAAPASASNRDKVRALLLQFAQELTDADSRSSLVKVLGRVDSYVDRIAPAQA
jgi:hypothetical protein